MVEVVKTLIVNYTEALRSALVLVLKDLEKKMMANYTLWYFNRDSPYTLKNTLLHNGTLTIVSIAGLTEH